MTSAECAKSKAIALETTGILAQGWKEKVVVFRYATNHSELSTFSQLCGILYCEVRDYRQIAENWCLINYRDELVFIGPAHVTN